MGASSTTLGKDKKEDLDEFMKSHSEQTGIAASIIVQDKVLWMGAFGLADQGLNKEVSVDTHFLIASISKIVTAIAVLQLYEAKKLDLDKDINDYISTKIHHPRFPDEIITARMLLKHISGLRDSEIGLHTWRSNEGDYQMSLNEFISKRFNGDDEMYQRQWSQTPPGKSSYFYSNCGFTLLGYLVEQVSELNLQEYCNLNIFKPLNIVDASFFMSHLDQSKVAKPYSMNKSFGNYCVAEYPACQLRISIRELTKIFMFFTNGHVDGVKLLQHSSTVEMMCPKNFQGGLAWWGLDASYGEHSYEVWTHGGYMDGVRTHVYYFPQHKSCILILTNSEHPYSAVYKKLKQVMEDTAFPQEQIDK